MVLPPNVVSVFTGCRSWKFVRAHASNRARWIDLTKSGGCRTNEALRFRRNRKFFRQIPKERQKLFGFAERRLPTPPPGASAAPAANASGINICADRWNRRFRKNLDSFRELRSAVSGEGGERHKWVQRHKWVHQTTREFLLCGPKNCPPAIKTPSKQGK